MINLMRIQLETWKSFFRDLGWVAWVNICDVAMVFSGVATVSIMLAGGARQAVAQEAPHLATVPGEGLYSPGVIPMIALLVVILHVVLREIVVPLVKRQDVEKAEKHENCDDCSGLIMVTALTSEQRKNQLDFNHRMEENVSRIFERLDEMSKQGR
jgi:hypothetical protein